MKYFLMTLLVLKLFVVVPALAAGGDVGNGGDAVVCQKAIQNPFSGTLSLDYMLTLQNGQENDLQPIHSFEESMTRISKIMADRCHEGIPTTKESRFSAMLEKFIASRSNHTDWSQPYIWHASAYGLVDIHDERLSRVLPKNCQTNGVPAIIQAIIRKPRPDMGMIVFEYDPDIELELQRQPLQQSFLYIHEFLRNYLTDIDKIRWLNWFLHSQQMEKLNEDDFRVAINRLMGNLFCSN
jgi:hypothetical protein